MNERGFSLLESLVAIAILGMILTAVLPSMMTYVDANTRNEERSGAVAAVQQTMEWMRQVNPGSLPAAGSTQPAVLAVDGREYEVSASYCLLPAYCGPESRHIVVEVHFGGDLLYRTESVFTRLR